MASTPIKIFNDPVHGFIDVSKTGLCLRVIDHPLFQRLRRIRQMGLSNLVYTGANHTRLSHAMGAMHLTQQAMRVLREKGHSITPDEFEATLVAILMHDIGHGPFSHALEGLLLPGVRHEALSLAIMQQMDTEWGGALQLAMAIFEGSYPKHYLHQLVSGQLDMDRMDYLLRDSFFTGVHEGVVGSDRIIKTLDVAEGKLVVEEKGIYSIEKFIIARRLMYWQVYLHKTALAAEQMLMQVLRRARSVVQSGLSLQAPPELTSLLAYSDTGVITDVLLAHFTSLDDFDIEYCLKQWQTASDPVLAQLCQRLVQRRLLKLQLHDEPIQDSTLLQAMHQHQQVRGWPASWLPYFVFAGEVTNLPYNQTQGQPIRILHRDGRLTDLNQASEMASIRALSEPMTKYYLCQPEPLTIA